MSLRFTNQNNPKKTLSLNGDAWFHILELAEEYGWNPLGTISAGRWYTGTLTDPQYDLYNEFGWDCCDGYFGAEGERLVLLEDALNLADALEQAFLDYEPLRIPSFYGIALSSPVKFAGTRPSIGAISAVVDFCRLGAFWIERQC